LPAFLRLAPVPVAAARSEWAANRVSAIVRRDLAG
jgi:hypothetical protein